MKKTIVTLNQDQDELSVLDISDDALEAAACTAKEGGAVTLAFCSGLDTCPA